MSLGSNCSNSNCSTSSSSLHLGKGPVSNYKKLSGVQKWLVSAQQSHSEDIENSNNESFNDSNDSLDTSISGVAGVEPKSATETVRQTNKKCQDYVTGFLAETSAENETLQKLYEFANVGNGLEIEKNKFGQSLEFHRLVGNGLGSGVGSSGIGSSSFDAEKISQNVRSEPESENLNSSQVFELLSGQVTQPNQLSLKECYHVTTMDKQFSGHKNSSKGSRYTKHRNSYEKTTRKPRNLPRIPSQAPNVISSSSLCLSPQEVSSRYYLDAWERYKLGVLLDKVGVFCQD